MVFADFKKILLGVFFLVIISKYRKHWALVTKRIQIQTSFFGLQSETFVWTAHELDDNEKSSSLLVTSTDSWIPGHAGCRCWCCMTSLAWKLIQAAEGCEDSCPCCYCSAEVTQFSFCCSQCSQLESFIPLWQKTRIMLPTCPDCARSFQEHSTMFKMHRQNASKLLCVILAVYSKIFLLRFGFTQVPVSYYHLLWPHPYSYVK